MIDNLLTKACVKYNDFCGTVAADIDDNLRTFDSYLESKGFNFDIYKPYSMKFIFSEKFLNMPRSTYLVINAINKQEIDSIEEYLEKSSENSLPIYKFTIEMNMNEFFNLFKRFEIDLGYYSKSLFNYSETVYEDVQENINLNK